MRASTAAFAGAVLAALLALAPAPAPAAEWPTGQSRTGVAVALDGDTLWMWVVPDIDVDRDDGPVAVRLWGIDAPEMRDWPLGARARAFVDDLVRDKSLACTKRGTDRYARAIARCHVEGDADADIGRAIVAAGWAVPYRRFTWPEDAIAARALDEAERIARLLGAGIWAD